MPSTTIGPSQPICTLSTDTSVSAPLSDDWMNPAIVPGEESIQGTPIPAATTKAPSSPPASRTPERRRRGAGVAADASASGAGMSEAGNSAIANSTRRGSPAHTQPRPGLLAGIPALCQTQIGRKNLAVCGRSSVGRALASQAGCRGFESLRPLFCFRRKPVRRKRDSRYSCSLMTWASPVSSMSTWSTIGLQQTGQSST